MPTSAPGLGLAAATSAPGLGLAAAHICTGAAVCSDADAVWAATAAGGLCPGSPSVTLCLLRTRALNQVESTVAENKHQLSELLSFPNNIILSVYTKGRV